MTTTEMTARALVVVACTFGSLRGQTPGSAPSDQARTATMTVPPLTFEVVSVKPAPPGSFPIVPAFMRDKGARILGLQRLAAPVSMLMGYAYHMQMSENLEAFRKQPEWVRNRVYTVTFRAEGEPTRDQVREMMRSMLAERFSLQTHEYTREGAVNRLVMSKPGVLGPKIKPHAEGASCTTQDGASVGVAPDASTPPVAHCGLVWYPMPGMGIHVGLTDATIAGAVGTLASMGVNGLETRPLVDATGMSGRYDLTVEFRPYKSNRFDSEADDSLPAADDGGIPTLIQALKQQLGLRVESGTGPVRMVAIDHLSEPTPD